MMSKSIFQSKTGTVYAANTNQILIGQLPTETQKIKKVKCNERLNDVISL